MTMVFIEREPPPGHVTFAFLYLYGLRYRCDDNKLSSREPDRSMWLWANKRYRSSPWKRGEGRTPQLGVATRLIRRQLSISVTLRASGLRKFLSNVENAGWRATTTSRGDLSLSPPPPRICPQGRPPIGSAVYKGSLGLGGPKLD